MNYSNFILKSSIGIRLSEKNYKYLFNNKTDLIINTIYIIIKPNIRFSNIYKFINLLIISEKKMNNKFMYILDDQILSGKKTLKIASMVKLNDRSITNNFINNFQYLYSKLMEDRLKYVPSDNLLERNKIFKENIKKILFLYFYHFDLDSYNYYDAISDAIYNMELFLKFNINRNHISNCLLSACNFNFYNFNHVIESDYLILTSEDNYDSDSDYDNNDEVNNNNEKLIDIFLDNDDYVSNLNVKDNVIGLDKYELKLESESVLDTESESEPDLNSENELDYESENELDYESENELDYESDNESDNESKNELNYIYDSSDYECDESGYGS